MAGFLAATTMVAIVNAAVAGTASAPFVASVLTLPTWAVATFGVFVALCVSAAFMVHQIKTWARVATALPGLIHPRAITRQAREPPNIKPIPFTTDSRRRQMVQT
jgi:hypothetical protein